MVRGCARKGLRSDGVPWVRRCARSGGRIVRGALGPAGEWVAAGLLRCLTRRASFLASCGALGGCSRALLGVGDRA